MSISRRSISLATAGLAAVAVATLTATTAVGAATAPAPSPWPQADANAAGSRTNATEATLTPSTVDGLHYLRSLTAAPPNPAAACDNPFQAPVIAGGAAFVGNSAGTLDRYDLATGKLQWRTATQTNESFVPERIAVAHGKVIVGARDCGSVSDPNGFLAAYDSKTGQQLWSTTPSPDDTGFADLVVSGQYVVAASGSTDGTTAELTVHRLSDGSVVWNRTTQGECAYRNVVIVHGEVVVADCAASAAPKIAAYALGSGNLTWSKPGAWLVQRGDSDTASGHHLFATKSNGVIADLDPTTGHGTGPLTGATAVVAVGLKRAYATCANHTLCAYELSDHSQAWSSSTAISTQVAVADGLVYTDEGDVVDGATGHFIEHVNDLGGASVTSLEVGYGRLLVQASPRVIDLYGLDGE